MGAVVGSRAGLYAYDVGYLELQQLLVDERDRGACQGVEAALCGGNELLLALVTLCFFHDPRDFGALAALSALFVGLALALFAAWAACARGACPLARAYASVDVTPADLPVWDVDGGDVPPRAWATLGELFSEDEHYEHAPAALLRSLELGLAALDPGRACMVDLHVATIAGAWGELDAAARVYGCLLYTSPSPRDS